MSADTFLRKTHRVMSGLFLLTIPLAGVVSFKVDQDAALFSLVYAPFLPMAFLTLTGTYLLVKPWIVKMRKGAAKSA